MNSRILDFVRGISREPKKEEIISLASKCGIELKYYRSGNSRHVIDIVGTDYVVKLAQHKGGLIQNEAECNSDYRKFKKLYNIPLAWNKSFSAILVQKLKTFDEIESDQVFLHIFNLTAQELYDYVQILQLNLKEDTSYYSSNITVLGSEFVSSWLKLHNNPESTLYNSELPGDYAKSDAYGITETGVVKILDFGNTELYFKLTK